MLPRGWRLTWIVTLGLLTMSAGLLLLYGSGEDGLRVWIRATARTSATLFLIAFLARPLHQLLRNDATRWMMKNRRYVGVSAAISHLIHLSAIVSLSVGWPAYRPDVVTLIFGGLGFILFFAMGLTSSNRAVAALGANWKRLHKFGAWYVWFIFALTFVPDPQIGWDLLHAVFELAFLGVALLRATLAVRQLRAATPA